MDIISLELIWMNLWKDNSDSKLIETYWIKIKEAYSAKGRYYHNIEHIKQMISSSEKYSGFINDLKTLQLAIIYHDFVYSVKSKKNEEKSALIAEQNLKKINYPLNLIEKCKQFIFATKNHINNLEDNDLSFLLDFDLEKLGDSWTGYFEYTQQIRQEYRIYPDIIYKKSRKKVLSYFLNLEYIYKTDAFREKCEKTARKNLIKEFGLL